MPRDLEHLGEVAQMTLGKVVGYLMGNKTGIGTLGPTRRRARPMGPPKVVPGRSQKLLGAQNLKMLGTGEKVW